MIVLGACVGALIAVVIVVVTGAFLASLTGPLWVIGGAVVGGEFER